MRKTRLYASRLVKVTRHYGEKNELDEFLAECNKYGYEITQVVDSGQGYCIFIYLYNPSENNIEL